MHAPIAVDEMPRNKSLARAVHEPLADSLAERFNPASGCASEWSHAPERWPVAHE